MLTARQRALQICQSDVLTEEGCRVLAALLAERDWPLADLAALFAVPGADLAFWCAVFHNLARPHPRGSLNILALASLHPWAVTLLFTALPLAVEAANETGR